MAEIVPFRGYRYRQTAVGKVTDVVAPPYDRIDPDVQRACYERSPYNIVRITKGIQEPGDSSTNNVYTRAAVTLEDWIHERILVRDPEPALYAYHQHYVFGGENLTRKGVVALGRLEPEKVHAHERTLRGPREDRLRLIRATEANFGHIFMLYTDPACAADAAIDASIAGRPPDIVAEDADGNAHRMWKVTEAETIGTFQQALVDKDLYIADGHHRYETAVNFMRECRERGWRPGAPESFDVRMMALFNIAEPGMSIRPIHRIVYGLPTFDEDAFFERVRERFTVVQHRDFERMAAATAAGAEAHTIGCATSRGWATLRLRDDVSLADIVPGDASEDVKRLDVSILHGGILEAELGIDAQALEEERHIRYTVDAQKGVKRSSSST